MLFFYIKDIVSGTIMDIGEVTTTQRELKSSGLKMDTQNIQDLPWTTIREEIYITPDEENYIIFYNTPFIMEFAVGKTGTIIVSGKELSDFYNDVGFSYYLSGDYSNASGFFYWSWIHNNKNEKAIYNRACMSALQGYSADALDYLHDLAALETAYSQQLLNKVLTDSDFDSIREDPEFKRFLEYLRVY